MTTSFRINRPASNRRDRLPSIYEIRTVALDKASDSGGVFGTLEEARGTAETLASGDDFKRVWIESDGGVVERLEVAKASTGWNKQGASRSKGAGNSRWKQRR